MYYTAEFYLHANMFTIEKLSDNDKHNMISNNAWNNNAPIGIDRLKKLKLSYLNFKDKVVNHGEMIVLDILANNVINIFKELLAIRFHIDNITPIHHYENSNDNLSMRANSSTCFNSRFIANQKVLSKHAFGVAIDINPVQNPYLVYDEDKITIYPPNGFDYVHNRHQNQKGVITQQVVDIFANYQFSVWGGNWDYNNIKDYHHFNISDKLFRELQF